MTPSIIFISNNDSSNDTAFCSQPTTTTVLPTSTRRTTTISFSPVVVVAHGGLHRFDYTSQEIESAWYSRVELRTMKRDNKNAGLLLNNSSSATLRGLESKTQRGAQQKRQNKKRAREAVFLEQKRQREEGDCDEEGLADLCYEATEHCQATAHMLGLRDEYEVKAMMFLQQEETFQQKVEADDNDDESVLKEEKSSTSIDPAGYCYRPIILRVLYEPKRKLVSSSAA
jgi:hypothetical protein